MKLAEQILENEHVQLEPLQEIHREALREAANADPEIWISRYPFSMAGEHFDPFWVRIQNDHTLGSRLQSSLRGSASASRAIFDPKKSFVASILVAPTTHLKFVGAS
jgi:hypothetical protein